MTGDRVDVDRRPVRTAGWWVRTVLMVLTPVAIGWLAARHNGTGVGVVVGLLAFIGAIFVFHPDDLGWALSLNGRMVEGQGARPSHLWKVWARISGLFLLVVCAAGAILYAPQALGPGCQQRGDGSVYCGPQPGDLVTESPAP